MNRIMAHCCGSVLLSVLCMSLVTVQGRKADTNLPIFDEETEENCGTVDSRFTINPECSPRSRIFGGTEANPHSLPWQVGLQSSDRNGVFCGGTLVSPIWVISAAHCFNGTDDDEVKYIIAGAHDQFRNNSGTEQTRIIAEMAIHPEYPDVYNDIVLLRVDVPFEITPYVKPACVPAFDAPAGENCIVSGWGDTTWGSKIFPENLKMAWLPIISRERCYELLGDDGFNDINMICAGVTDGRRGDCNGDSGGPLVCPSQSKQGQWFLNGIVSWGYGCGGKDNPGVYTRVTAFRKWIPEVVNRNSSTEEERVKGKNLALNRPAFQKDVKGDGIASRAVDGNAAAEWRKSSCTQTQKSDQPWWAVDLGQTTSITSVKITNRAENWPRLTNFQIGTTNKDPNQTAPVIGEYNVCARHTTKMGSGKTKKFECKASGRYIIVQLKRKNVLSLCEVEVYGRMDSDSDALPGKNLALNRPAYQKDVRKGGIASRAVDGNAAAEWIKSSCTQTKWSAQPWWAVDLGQTTRITSVKITNIVETWERLSNFQIGTTYKNPKQNAPEIRDYKVCAIQTAAMSSGETKEFDCKVKGRYVIIQLKGKNFLSLCEVEVYGRMDSDADALSEVLHRVLEDDGKLLNPEDSSELHVPIPRVLEDDDKQDDNLPSSTNEVKLDANLL